MRIENNLPPLYAQNPAPPRYANPALSPEGLTPEEGKPQNQGGADFTVDISPRGWAASRETKGIAEDFESQECKTCKGRKYQDVSNDPSVSFQAPTHISPGQSAAAVASHEGEHVSHEQAKAEQDGREVVSQTVTLKTSICPECKRIYVSGGETRTITRRKVDMEI